MALIRIVEDFHPENHAALLDRAKELMPVLHHRIVLPKRIDSCSVISCQDGILPEELPHISLGKGEELCLDFGAHYVGRIMLDLSHAGSHQDAPAFLKLTFAETRAELEADSEQYKGWISGSWVPEEYIHVDVLPARLVLPRRYALRYLKISVIDTSPKYKVVVRHAECMTQTSADPGRLDDFSCRDAMLERIYQVSLATLKDCMQEVFEDGPKRDRRLWTGDFRLQALTNAVSFRNGDLVKRCLYLFAGSRFPDGRVSACLFTEPEVAADDTYLFDYALFFVITLEEYLEEYEDAQALEELYDVAMEQIDIALDRVDDDGCVTPEMVADTFIDWNDEVDKSGCALAVLIYALAYAVKLADRKGDARKAGELAGKAEYLKQAALKHYWDEKAGCFLSNGQKSIATQVWMVLADVPEPEAAAELMGRAQEFADDYPMQTPYMHHYYVMALLHAGRKEDAVAHIKAYWGSMIEAGADTFYEAWNPDDPGASPYGEGGSIVNSYCHAWSCTPAYIIRRFLT